MRYAFVYILFSLIPILCFSQSGKDFALAEQMTNEGNYAEARLAYTKIIESAKGSRAKLFDAYQARAKCNKMLANYAEALGDYDSALAIEIAGHNNLSNLAINKSDLLIQMGAYKEAYNLLTSLRNLNMRQELYRKANLSLALMCEGKKWEAISLLDSVVGSKNIDSTSLCIALQNRGYMYMTPPDVDYEKAVSDFSKSLLSLDGVRYCIVLSNKAVAESKLGFIQEALADIDVAVSGLEKALGKRHPDYIRALRKKAEILLLFDKAKAQKEFEEYFRYEKEYVIENFASMTEQNRLDFWKKEKPLLSEIFELESAAPDFLLDVSLFRRELAMFGMQDFAKGKQKVKEQFSIILKSADKKFGN